MVSATASKTYGRQVIVLPNRHSCYIAAERQEIYVRVDGGQIRV